MPRLNGQQSCELARGLHECARTGVSKSHSQCRGWHCSCNQCSGVIAAVPMQSFQCHAQCPPYHRHKAAPDGDAVLRILCTPEGRALVDRAASRHEPVAQQPDQPPEVRQPACCAQQADQEQAGQADRHQDRMKKLPHFVRQVASTRTWGRRQHSARRRPRCHPRR